MKLIHKILPLNTSKDLDPLLKRAANSTIVMLGEASHGTHEYYTWRNAIARRLIEEQDFNIIAVEGDWPDCYRINRYIKGYDDQDKQPEELLKAFNRWPTWLWANREIVSLITWLKQYNSEKPADKRIGFYGLDVYSLWESMETLLDYLEKNDLETAEIAEKAMACFERHGKDERSYAFTSLTDSCREEVLQLLQEVRKNAAAYDHDPEAALNAKQNAHIIAQAEKYYTSMLSFNDQSWNIRDQHMMETLTRLLEFFGAGTKVMVMAHNTHVGDARHTDMQRAGLLSIGQLAREYYGEEQVLLTGMGCYKGTVIAGSKWSAPFRQMEVPKALSGSWESNLHSSTHDNGLLIFERPHTEDELFLQRAIGVVYDPAREEHNYVPGVINRRYDVFLYFENTEALHPLQVQEDEHQLPATYPFEV